CLQYNSFPFSF
nr:immunoglobulin light chain junction region [Macaca mulatta]MOV62594.1 immunoglobulin light chain junction region [Macaca mulatta]